MKSCSLKEPSLTDACCLAPVYFVFPGYYILNVLVLILQDKILVQFQFLHSHWSFHWSFRDNRHTRSLFNLGFLNFWLWTHLHKGESLTTALVEVKFNSLTLAALSFNIAKDLLVFSISPLSQSRAVEIEFSLNIAHRRIVLGCHPYGRFCLNNSKLFLLLYVDQRNVATAVLV